MNDIICLMSAQGAVLLLNIERHCQNDHLNDLIYRSIDLLL